MSQNNNSGGKNMAHQTNEAMNKVPPETTGRADDAVKNNFEILDNTTTDEEARREQMRSNILMWMKKLTIVLICFIGISLISYVVISLCFSDWSKVEADNFYREEPLSHELNFSSKLGVYSKAAVCSDKGICSKIGSSLLKIGGSAVDAAIGTLLCNGVVLQQSMGIGGGMFMNVYIKEEKRAYTIDAREVAPHDAHPNMYAGKKGASLTGGLSIAVPGELRGYYNAHQRFGKLAWKKLVEPSIKLCEDGFYMTEHLRMAILQRMEHMKNDTILRNVYFDQNNGNMYPVGSKLKTQKELCETYKLLAENGPNSFYNGTLAELVVADLKDLGSIVNSYDLKAYSADVMNSISVQLGNDVLYTPHPVSSGIVVANVLSILEGYNFTTYDLRDAEHMSLTIHRMTEALKFGYAKRWELGDLRFNDVRQLISKLSNPEHAAQLRRRINDAMVLGEPSAYDAQFMGKSDVGTSHTSVIAPNGDAVSVTSSINNYFGSSQAGKRTGIVFNSGMNDFSITDQANLFNLPPAITNFIEPWKRPMSSMAPLILASQDGNVRMVVGSAGGSKILAAVVEVIARVLWFKNDIKEAIDAPRFYHQLVPNILEYDIGSLSNEVLKILQDKGQITKSFDEIGTVVCGIVRNATAIYANADYRKRGDTAGF